MVPDQQWSRPSEALCSYIRVFAQRNNDLPGTSIVSAVPARLEQLLNFELAEKFELHFDDSEVHLTPEIAVVGPQTRRRCDVVLKGRLDSFGIFFQPSGFSRLFGHPIRTMVDQYHEARPLVGPPLRELRGQLGDTRSFQKRIAIAEAFFLKCLRTVHAGDPILDAADYILARYGSVRIKDLADRYGVGIRQFERKFTSSVGYPPKLHARIARFQSALDMKIRYPDKTWRDIAHVLCYHDQMHMIHDFAKLGGGAPGQVLQEAREQRPPALLVDPR